MKNKKIIIITAIVLIVVIATMAGCAISNSNKNTHKGASKDVQASSTTETTESTEATTEKKTDATSATETVTAEDVLTTESDNKDDDTVVSNTGSNNGSNTPTSEDIRNGNVTVSDESRNTTESTTQSTTQSTKSRTTQTTTESTTVAPEPTHSHSYSPTYGTTNVQQYASDGTTNDYNKPIYGTQQVEKTREVPVYETHQVDVNGNDITAAWNNGGREEWRNSGCWNGYNDDYNNMVAWQSWKYGTHSRGDSQVQVGTTTETYYETEEVVTGYEQLGTISKKTITGYTCSCGKSISVAKYVSQYGTPSGYYLDGEILVHN